MSPKAPLEIDSPVSQLPGIGPGRAARLAAAGVHTVEDLLLHLPVRFEDRQKVPGIASLQAGRAATIRARVVEAKLIRTRRRGLTIVQARVSDETGSLRAVWFNQPWLAKTIQPGREGYFFAAPAAS